MNVLWIHGGNPNGNSKRLHIGFRDEFSRLCSSFNSIEARTLADKNKKTKRVIVHNTIDKYIDRYNPDVVICYAKTKSFNHLPLSYLVDVSCLKVMIEVDYKHKFIPWYKSNKFDFIFQRGCHARNDINKIGIPIAWLPFSANHKIFKPNPEITLEKRIKKVGIPANINKAYPQRKNIIKALKKYDLFSKSNKRKVINKEYVKFLQNVLINVSTGEKINTPRGKVFEIMGCGSILLTTKCYGMNILFDPKKQCYIEVNDNLDDLWDKCNDVINNKSLANKIQQSGRLEFLKKHTEEIRTRELYNGLQNLLQGKDVERKWGH